MDNFLIRKANLKDLKEILRMNFDLFKKEHREFDKSLDLKWTNSREGKKYFRSRITEKDGFAVVVESNGEIIGYLCGGISRKLSFRKEAKYAELENMLIEKKFRDKGLGAKITKDFLKWCRKNKVDYVSVTASAKNENVLQFYRKQGFKDYNLGLEIKLRKK